MPNSMTKPWVKGMPSPNPTGINNPTDVTVQTYARRYTLEAMRTLVHLMRHSKKEPLRRQCANDLLDRGWGKPTQSIDLDAPEHQGLLALLTNAHQHGAAMIDAAPMIERVVDVEVEDILNYVPPNLRKRPLKILTEPED